MNESFENQVMRVLNEMVKAGTILASRLASGEMGYTLQSKAPVKSKPATTAARKKIRSEAARKAWVTRHKNEKLKAVRKLAAYKAVKTKQKNRATKVNRSAAAYQAWVTRRSLAE